MDGNKCYKAGIWGSIIAAICCFTPVLVIGLGVIGLAALTPYLDYVLFPMLALLLILTIYGWSKSRKSSSEMIMSACCIVDHDGAPPACPTNGQTCKPVGRVTLESLLNAETKASLSPQPYYFCDASDCDTVYVSALADHLVTKDQLTVRVGIKETEDPVPLCYCFNFDRKAIWEGIRLKGATDIPKIITRRVKAGECRCEETNPSGTCCLGNVYRVVKQAQAMKQQAFL